MRERYTRKSNGNGIIPAEYNVTIHSAACFSLSSEYCVLLVLDGEDTVDRFAGGVLPSQSQTYHPCVLKRGVARQYATTYKLARALEVFFSRPAASINLQKRGLEAVTTVVRTCGTIQNNSLSDSSTIVSNRVKYTNHTFIEVLLNYL